jgi:enoyl-CoA hydratase
MADTGDPRIRLDFEDHTALITIARPEKLNALDFEMTMALERAAGLVDQAPDISAAIITGEGEKSFCAGGDIEAWSKLQPQDFAMQWVRRGHRAFDALAQLRVPLIAALNGHALGGGLELAATADIRIAGRHVKIGMPETSIGIIPGWSGTQRAVRRFGAPLVRRMALAGEVFTAEEAVSLGIVDRLGSLDDARRMAEKIAARSPQATQLAKLMINAAEGEESEAAIEALGGYVAAAGADLKHGLEAFRAKKPPNF